MTKPGVTQRRFWFGLLLSLLVGIGIQQWLLLQARQAETEEEARRTAIITVQSFVEMVQLAGAEEDQVAAIVSEFTRLHPELKNIRIVRGMQLLASTVPSDNGQKAAPRRLMRNEKWIFDTGQRLRAAVLTNREEGVSRKTELEIVPVSGGGLVLSSPIEEEGLVVGYVQAETRTRTTPMKANWMAPVVAVLLPLLAFTGFCFFVTKLWRAGTPDLRTTGEDFVVSRRGTLWALAAGAFVILIAALFLFGRFGLAELENDIGARLKATGQAIQQESDAGSRILLQGLSTGDSPTLHPSKWDVDQFRRPRGMFTDTGAIDEKKLAANMRLFETQFNKVLLLLILLSAAILALSGFGVFSRLGGTILEFRHAYAYTLPAMIGMIVLVFFPFVYGIVLSFTGSTLYNTNQSIPEIWIGLENYKSILGDFNIVKRTAAGVIVNYQNFYYTFLFTIFWTVSNVTIGVTFGLILALILNIKGFALKPIYRVLLILPWAMPNYITALIWKGMFHQQFGVINQAIQIFGGTPVSWFQKPLTSFMTALATNGWLSFPFMMVVSLGALQSIPSDLYEAARVDGASRWQQFRSITLPSLKPALVPAIILSVVWTFNMFNIIYLVTQGEPAGSTEILVTQAYKIAFEKYRYGYSAAYSTVIFMILLIYGSIQNRVTRATEAIAG
jgi:arabinogalactan oligomer / maltooligosaccharide transport system permease protein